MQTVLTETFLTHLQMATMALASRGRLENWPENIAFFSMAARLLGVDEIVHEPKGISFKAGEIFVISKGETIAHFIVEKDGQLLHWPWDLKQSKPNAA